MSAEGWDIYYFGPRPGKTSAEQVLDEAARFSDLPKCNALINRLAQDGYLRDPNGKNFTDVPGVSEVRVFGKKHKYRFFYKRISGGRIVILHAIVKKTPKTPKSDVDTVRLNLRNLEASLASEEPPRIHRRKA